MFSIDYKSRVPLYQQIVENVERLALAGALAPDSQLPSVRALAVELSLNPNTVARAYSELEARGVIYSLPGRGNFLSADTGLLRNLAWERLLLGMSDLSAEARSCGLDYQRWQELCHAAWAGRNSAKGGMPV